MQHKDLQVLHTAQHTDWHPAGTAAELVADIVADIAVRQAVESGEIEKSRYDSYLRLYEKASQIKEWELK